MAFVRNETRSGNTAALNRVVPGYGRAFRWVAISGAGVALASLSLATVTGLVFLATSFTSPIDFVPHAQKAATPGQLALAAALYSSPARRNCQSGCAQRTQYIVQQAKSARVASAVGKRVQIASVSLKRRFDQARASLTHDKLASAFAPTGIMVAALETPLPLALKERFYPATATAVSLLDRQAPASPRFGPKVAEVERSSRLAATLAGSGEIEIAYAPDTGSFAGPTLPWLAQVTTDDGTETAATPAFESMPESAPLPGTRPNLDPLQTPKPRISRPARQASEPQQALAYASPNDDAPSIGQAFKNLFSSSDAGSGVAVYDISAQTVTLPNGQKLEAHSGLGHMVDNPRYVDQKMRGPTPPNTYNLVMRESRFHGVEAIRLIPVDGKNKYGRDGLLAHTYMLRGGRAESNGCVVFEEYDRFLKAFKKGNIKRLVVVPGGGRSSTRIAKNGERA